MSDRLTRREFLFSTTVTLTLARSVEAGTEQESGYPARSYSGAAIIDIHQHIPYSGRTGEALLEHQRRLGIDKTVILPAGRRLGLAAGVGGNQDAYEFAWQRPGRYYFFANEVPDIPETREVLEKYLKLGAIGIGEQKFPVECDSKHIQLVASIAEEFDVPVLLHFQHEAYNLHFERFYRILEKYPRVSFIGHAQTWWGNIDRHHDQSVMYPGTPVTPGGLTDRYLSDYPNVYGDLSAGSGRNALARDEEHAREFVKRHQDKLLFGSDCSDSAGRGPDCIGAGALELLRRLVPDEKVLKKILHDNAARLLKLA